MKILIPLVTLFALAGCGISSHRKEEVEVQSDDLEFVVDSLDSGSNASEFSVEAQKVPINEVSNEFADHEPIKFTDETVPVAKDEEIIIASDIQEPKFEEFKKSKVEKKSKQYVEAVQMSNQQEIYHVQSGDTLMLIAHKIYGDYSKWKSLRDLNKVQETGKLSRNMALKYYVPSSSFNWQPEGSAHLVKTGETLGTISMDKYGTAMKWKYIYENNRPIIRNPNLIFAGFTIYYKPGRELASKPR